MRNDNRHLTWLFGSLILTGALALPGLLPAAGEPWSDTGWRIRLFAASIDFDRGNSYHGGTRPGSDIDFGFGIGFNAEYRFSRRLGIDLGILGGAAVDTEWSTTTASLWPWTAYDTLAFTPLSAGLDIHLTPDKDVDIYVCPMLSWIHYGGLVFHSTPHWPATTIDFHEDLGAGIALGLGVPVGSRERWLFSANLIHLESDIESRNWSGGRLAEDYDATILGLGFGYKF